MVKLSAACLVVLAIVPAVVLGQSQTTAALSGTITDPSELPVPKAKVTAVHNGTGGSREAVSDLKGEYRIPLLTPGSYDLTIQAEGFAVASRRAVRLTVGETLTLDVELALGASSQLVEIQADVPLVETERIQQSNTLDQQAVGNLPINRRDYLTFALLAPGVADSKALADANSFRVKQNPDSGLSFYGSNGRGNSITVDGGQANDPGGGVRPTVSQETVQEFQVNRANYSAEHGSARGGVVNIITKSGTNEIRGSAFAFFRNQAMDAGDPFAIELAGDRLARVKPDSSRQQFGGTFGGPVAKDKAFYFLGYEQLRRRESATVPVLTDWSIFQPTPAQERTLQGLPAAASAPLRAALTSPPATVDLFRLNSGVFPFRTDDHKGMLRLDWRPGDADSFTFRLNSTDSHETNQNLQALVGYSRGYVTDQFDIAGLLGWTRTVSSRTINELRLQYDYYNLFNGTNDKFGPALEIAGYGYFNRDRFLPSDTTTRTAEILDHLSWNRGSHSMKVGGTLLIRSNRTDSATFMSGRFTFGALPGAIVNPALATTTITALQAFNLGLAQSYQQGFGDPVVSATHPLYAAFIQDNWKAARNLTLSFGLRYEVDTRKTPLPTDRNNLSPRGGFAWDPWGDHKTTVRGGYGLFYATIDFGIDYVVNALAEIDGYRQIAQVLTVLSPTDPLARTGPVNIYQTLRRQGIVGVPVPERSVTSADLRQFGITVDQRGPRPPLTVLFRADPTFRNPYSQQASLALEREVAPGLSVSAGYVFVRGARLSRSRDVNLLAAPVNPAKGIRDWGATAQNPSGLAFFRDPLLFQENLYESTANSFYHGLMLEGSKRFGHGFSLHGNYTFSKAIDDVVDYNSDFQPADQINLRAERALSAFDQRHKVVFYGMMQAPARAGGFSLMPIFRANSARPFNLLAGVELNNDRHSTTDRPVFAGRNTGIGPGFWTIDARLSRRFRIDERRGIELMAEGFNLLNHLNFASVNNTVGNIGGEFRLHGRHDRGPSEPLGFTSAFDPRRIQLGLRLQF